MKIKVKINDQFSQRIGFIRSFFHVVLVIILFIYFLIIQFICPFRNIFSNQTKYFSQFPGSPGFTEPIFYFDHIHKWGSRIFFILIYYSSDNVSEPTYLMFLTSDYYICFFRCFQDNFFINRLQSMYIWDSAFKIIFFF